LTLRKPPASQTAIEERTGKNPPESK